MTTKVLNIRSDFQFRFSLTRTNGTTGADEAATGLSGITGRIALTPNGSALGSTSTALSEIGTTGNYFGVCDTATLVSALAAYLGRIVFVICAKSGDLDGEYERYLVSDSHEMGAA